MGPISGSFSPLANAARLQNNGNNNTTGNPGNNTNASERPDEDNVTNRDRAQNSSNLELNSNRGTTVAADVSREQVVNALEQNSQRQQAQTFIRASTGEQDNTQLNISAPQALAAANASGASRDDVREAAVGFANLQQQAELAEDAIDQFNENQQQIQNNDQDSEDELSSNAVAEPNETFVELSGQASQAQSRNAFISSEFVSQLDTRQGSLFDQTV